MIRLDSSAIKRAAKAAIGVSQQGEGLRADSLFFRAMGLFIRAAKAERAGSKVQIDAGELEFLLVESRAVARGKK